MPFSSSRGSHGLLGIPGKKPQNTVPLCPECIFTHRSMSGSTNELIKLDSQIGAVSCLGAQHKSPKWRCGQRYT